MDEQRFVEKLATETIVWLTTVRHDGQPQTSPVWFVWNDGAFLIYSRPGTQKIRNILANPRVALALEQDGTGSDVATMEARAVIDEEAPSANEVGPYVAKYGPRMEAISGSHEEFAQDYRIALRVEVTRRRLFD
jgi:PPOX class probable F420-dependent enzyme